MIQFYPKSLLTRFSGMLLLCLLSVGVSAQVFSDDFTISTQADLDGFTDPNNGGAKYTSVDGDILIDPSEELTDFSNLSELTLIDGDLEIINYNTDQTEGNPLSQFTSLTTTDDVIIQNSDGITSISSVPLTTINGNFNVNNLGAANGSGFTGFFSMTNLVEVTRSFSISAISGLIGFTAPALTTIGNNIEITVNPNLGNLLGFANVRSVGGSIILRGNPSLDNIGALGGDGGARLDVDDLVVDNNEALDNFGTSSDAFRVRVKRRLTIVNNPILGTTRGSALGTNIEVGIAGQDVELLSINISGNSFTDTDGITSTGIASISGIFNRSHRIFVNDYQLNGNNFLTGPFGSQPVTVRNNLSIVSNARIQSLPLFGVVNQGTTALTGALTISNNAQLRTTANLRNLTSVNGTILVSSNPRLADLQVFNALTQAGAIAILNNALITSLNNFAAASLNITSTFVITGNSSLSNCCEPTCKTTVAGQPFDGTNSAVAINNNATGSACEDKQAVVNADCKDASGNTKACLIAAPVEFIAFSGALEGSAIVLDWATATETENDYFQIERSNDGATFTAIGKVTGSGDSQEELNYTFSDLDYQSGVNYYRLRQVDYDGTEDFSKVIVVDAGAGNLALGMFPNPTTGSDIRVRLSNDWDADNVTLDIYSAGGQLMISTTNTRNAIPVNRLAPGMYAVRVSDGQRTATERLVVR